VKRTTCFVLVALLIGAGLGASAQTASTVLDIEPGVAALGAGATGLSMVRGAETLFFNPAGLAALPGISFSSSLSTHLGVANYSQFALAFTNFAVGALILNSGDIQGYDASGGETETLSYGSTSFQFAGGIRPSDLPFVPDMGLDFAVGARLKTVSADIAGDRGSGFALDFGFLAAFADTTLGPIRFSDIAIGLTVDNLIGSLSYDDDQEDFTAGISFGASALIMDMVRAGLDVRLAGTLNFGLAYAPVPTLELRLGVIAGQALSITGGLGVSVQGFVVDYAFRSHPVGASHRVSLSLDFSSLNLGGGIGQILGRLLP